MKEAVAHYIGDDTHTNVQILRHAMESAVDTRVQVAPLHDVMVTSLGVWLRGAERDISLVMIDLKRRLQKEGIHYAFKFWLDLKRDNQESSNGEARTRSG
jgi:hypothetical protein